MCGFDGAGLMLGARGLTRNVNTNGGSMEADQIADCACEKLPVDRTSDLVPSVQRRFAYRFETLAPKYDVVFVGTRFIGVGGTRSCYSNRHVTSVCSAYFVTSPPMCARIAKVA